MIRAKTFALAAAAVIALGSASVQAGGVGGDLLNMVVPGAGTLADEAHRQFKSANPDYGKAEEQLTNDVREGIGLEPHCDPLYNKWGEQVGCQ
jgi:hypothetical protein